MRYDENDFKDFSPDYEGEYDYYDLDYENRCPECGSTDVRHFGIDIDKCYDCGAFLEAEDFDDDQEGTDPMNKPGYRDEWDY